MKQQFIDFLKENNLYEEFLTNLKNDGEFSSLDELCEAKEPYRWIIGAFEWFKQDQHWKVWDELDEKWQEMIGTEIDFLE